MSPSDPNELSDLNDIGDRGDRGAGSGASPKRPVVVATMAALADRVPVHAQVDGIDLVIVCLDGEPRVLYGRCTHRNALLSEGRVEGAKLICALHGWDYDCHSGHSSIGDEESVPRFVAWVQGDQVYVDAEQIRLWRARTPVDFLDGELD